MNVEFLDRLASLLKARKSPACRRAINRILDEMKQRCEVCSMGTNGELCWGALTNTGRATVEINHDLDALMRDLVGRFELGFQVR
jgi:hypothetical protein